MQQKFIFAIDIKGIKHLKPLFTDLSTRLCCYLWGGGCVAIAFQESWRLNRAGLARWLIYVLVSNRLRLLRCWPNPRFEPLKPGEEESEGWTWREHPFWRGGGEAGRAEASLAPERFATKEDYEKNVRKNWKVSPTILSLKSDCFWINCSVFLTWRFPSYLYSFIRILFCFRFFSLLIWRPSSEKDFCDLTSLQKALAG